jgi:hypothetical protein
VATSPASGPGGGSGGTFNGGTITDPLVIALTDPTETALTILLPTDAGNEDAVQVAMIDEDDVPLYQLFADGGSTVNADPWGGSDARTFAANRGFKVTTGSFVIARTSAPADADLTAGTVSLWLDDTPAATKLMVKAKDSGGTVRTAAINLA